MLHLVLSPPDIPVSQGDGLIVVLGSTSPNWKSPLLRNWAESSRRHCLLQRERSKHKRHRKKGPERLQKLKNVYPHPSGLAILSEPWLRMLAIHECRSIPGYPEASGSNAPAVAIDFPDREVRHRGFTCLVSTNWDMHLESSMEDAIREEAARGWNILENAELQCAEVEAGVEMERLVVRRILSQI